MSSNRLIKTSIKLNDEAIRSILIGQLSRMGHRPKAILEEVRVHYGNAIADVVTVHDHPHCYEIKGSTDNIYRALRQGLFYERSFKKMTLVTAERFVLSAEKFMPDHWGIISAKIANDKIKLAYIRPSRINPSFDKVIALHTLWKSELLASEAIKNLRGAKSLNRDQLANIISNSLTEDALLKFIGQKLAGRISNPENP